MTMTPEEKLAMARECAAEAKEGSFTAHLAPECIEEIREGGHDDWEEVQSALLAIDRMQERVRAEGDWQDIATAPRDGSFIDIWFAPQTDTGKDLIACRVPNCSWEDGNWYTDRNARIWGRVTHWRPLPSPPAIREIPHAE